METKQQYLPDGLPSFETHYDNSTLDDLSTGGRKKPRMKVFHDFYKTKMCPQLSNGTCPKGEECPFAHSDGELREKPNLTKTKLCENFMKAGTCDDGDNCVFAHGENELRSTPDLFKTALCYAYAQGKCPAGDRCRYAHGEEELRPAPSNPRGKKQQFFSDTRSNGTTTSINSTQRKNNYKGGYNKYPNQLGAGANGPVGGNGGAYYQHYPGYGYYPTQYPYYHNQNYYPPTTGMAGYYQGPSQMAPPSYYNQPGIYGQTVYIPPQPTSDPNYRVGAKHPSEADSARMEAENETASEDSKERRELEEESPRNGKSNQSRPLRKSVEAVQGKAK